MRCQTCWAKALSRIFSDKLSDFGITDNVKRFVTSQAWRIATGSRRTICRAVCELGAACLDGSDDGFKLEFENGVSKP